MSYRPGETDFSVATYLKVPQHRAVFAPLSIEQLFALYALASEFDDTANDATSQQLVDMIEYYVLHYTDQSLEFAQMMLESELASVHKQLTFFVISIDDNEKVTLAIFRKLLSDPDPEVRRMTRRQIEDRINEARLGESDYALELGPDLRKSRIADASTADADHS